MGSSLSFNPPFLHVRDWETLIFSVYKISDVLMGLDMELEFDKYCKLSGSPKTVLPSSRRRSKVEKRIIKGKPTYTNDLLSLDQDFRDISFCYRRSSSCTNIPSQTSGLEGNEVLKQGSVYQSTREARKMKKSGAVEGRRKIELSGSHAFKFSSGIVESLWSSDEDCSSMEHERSSVMPLNSDRGRTPVPIVNVEWCSQEFLDLSFRHGTENVISSDERLEIPLSLHSRDNCSTENAKRDETDDAFALHKSLSAKLALPHSPSRSVSDSSRPSSPKSQFSPVRKMFDPVTKSKSRQSPLGSASRSGGLPPAQLPSTKRRSNTLRKSLLNDFSNTSPSPEFGSQFVKKSLCNSAVACSPAHLHGCLKLENKRGVPFFEFSLKSPEDVLVARTWKAGNGVNWVYTFHSLHNRRKSNATGWGLKDCNKDSSMVGQMQVSCYLCTEIKDAGTLNDSIMTEFVLYNVAHARQSVAAQGNPIQSPDVVKPPSVSNQSSVGGARDLADASDQMKVKLQPKHATDTGHFDSPTLYPWAPTDLHPNLEIAAIVIQVPFQKRESLKYRGGDSKSDQPLPSLLDLSVLEQRKDVPDCSSPTKLNVVTPSGNHSLPSIESHGPSTLLDRWRMGGGCDCGGWDMACPLTVFGNPNIQSTEDYPLMENWQPLELFVQGAKENTPALTMAVTEEGRYSVDFHAQLSTLQAFSICVAILHCTEASIAVRQERDKPSLQCSSLRVFVGEEVRNLIEAVTKEEKRKISKKMETIPTTFKLNPPFSPIARV